VPSRPREAVGEGACDATASENTAVQYFWSPVSHSAVTTRLVESDRSFGCRPRYRFSESAMRSVGRQNETGAAHFTAPTGAAISRLGQPTVRELRRSGQPRRRASAGLTERRQNKHAVPEWLSAERPVRCECLVSVVPSCTPFAVLRRRDLVSPPGPGRRRLCRGNGK
jgi:hypothetical protein